MNQKVTQFVTRRTHMVTCADPWADFGADGSPPAGSNPRERPQLQKGAPGQEIHALQLHAGHTVLVATEPTLVLLELVFAPCVNR
jgi:hypothetical protein